ncbi:Smr protein/MutS2 [Nitrosomonas sp. Is79A3]|uniref:Smr/MutS family protein n=1 Tax=Nitrosomonas sp. (strain Is79A3) TaxID=261292 RepID=UPI000215D229
MTKKDSAHDEDEMALFYAAMRDVSPLPATDKLAPSGPKIPPIPRKKNTQEQAPAEDALSDHIAMEIEAGDEWSYLRPGMSRQTLRRLRRGYWGIQDNLDLHGFTRDEARQELSAFLDACVLEKYRCVRVIHGKGLSSKNREPVLKIRIGNWLMQRADVLAFCQAKPEDGGGGAILILLKVNA